jgi:lipoprotein-anchoring transpeptidase ErfK/SrfK
MGIVGGVVTAGTFGAGRGLTGGGMGAEVVTTGVPQAACAMSAPTVNRQADRPTVSMALEDGGITRRRDDMPMQQSVAAQAPVERGLPTVYPQRDVISPAAGRLMQRRTRSLIAIFAVPIAGALVFGLGAARAPGAASSTLTLEASLSERKLTLKRDGEVVKTYDVAVGAPAHPTPTGNFTIRKMVWNPAWVPPAVSWAKGSTAKAPGHPANPMKTVKIFFQEPDYYIHGTGAVESLGEAASHGCMRMDPNDAAEVALMVMENGGVARDLDWVKGILHLGEQRVVTMQQTAPLAIVP